jgi:hypothetical protein
LALRESTAAINRRCDSFFPDGLTAARKYAGEKVQGQLRRCVDELLGAETLVTSENMTPPSAR